MFARVNQGRTVINGPSLRLDGQACWRSCLTAASRRRPPLTRRSISSSDGQPEDARHHLARIPRLSRRRPSNERTSRCHGSSRYPRSGRGSPDDYRDNLAEHITALETRERGSKTHGNDRIGCQTSRSSSITARKRRDVGRVGPSCEDHAGQRAQELAGVLHAANFEAAASATPDLFPQLSGRRRNRSFRVGTSCGCGIRRRHGWASGRLSGSAKAGKSCSSISPSQRRRCDD